MKISIVASGPKASGKSFILGQIIKLLKLYGFRVSQQIECQPIFHDGVPTEQLVMKRDDDEAHFVMGDKIIQLGDWTLELDNNNALVSAFHDGKDVNAREIEVNFAFRQFTTITTKDIIGRDGIKEVMVDDEQEFVDE